MFKFLRRIIFLVVLLIIAAVVLLFSLDGLVKSAVEKGGTYALSTPTTVEKTSVSLMSKTFDMTGLRVANPPGYSAEAFLKVDGMHAAMPDGSVFSQPVHLKNLDFSGLHLRIEQGSSGLNYEVITEALKRFQSTDKKDDGGSKRLIIDDLTVKNVTVTAQLLPIPGFSPAPQVTLPDIHLTNVGAQDNQGVLIADVVNVLVQSLLNGLASQGGAGLLPANLAKDLGGRIEGLNQVAGGAFKLIDQLGGGKDSPADKIKKGLGGILNGGKK